MNNEIEKPKRKMKKLTKIIIVIISILVVLIGSFLFLLYGPYKNFREWLITTAMTTMSHQYLATIFYDEKTIDEVLKQNYVKESGENTDGNQVIFNSYKSSSMFLNKYEKEILTKEKGNDLYKKIDITGEGQRGYLVAIYDPSKVKVATSAYMGTKGQMLTTIAKNNNAVVAMNASGFVDPNYNSNGGIPHGVVIKDGKIVSNQARYGSGGLIGFNKENKLILSRMTASEAINQGIRDAVDFGPFLIVNGKPSFIKGNGGWGIAPRSAIGQRKDGIVLLLVINGRIPSSIGADMVDLCDIMENYGAYNAANLDGGSSTELVIKNKIINTPVAGGKNGLRDMSTFWIIKE